MKKMKLDTIWPNKCQFTVSRLFYKIPTFLHNRLLAAFSDKSSFKFILTWYKWINYSIKKIVDNSFSWVRKRKERHIRSREGNAENWQKWAGWGGSAITWWEALQGWESICSKPINKRLKGHPRSVVKPFNAFIPTRNQSSCG